MRGIQAHLVIRSGEPGTEILDEIAAKNYDLVAIATHGHTFVGDLLFDQPPDGGGAGPIDQQK